MSVIRAMDARAAVLIPVKAFARAKLRLAPALGRTERAALAEQMAGHVVAVSAPFPCFVVCDDDEVAAWARSAGAEVIWRPGRGLNGAVADGVIEVASAGYERVVVAHGDLPHARDFTEAASFDGVTLVPDRRDDGTNVACVPSGAGFVFDYGPGSFTRHVAEAARLELPLRVLREPRLAWDVDSPDDLQQPEWVASLPAVDEQ